MEIKKQQFKIKCDMPGCKNLSGFVMENKTFFGNSKVCFCEECIKKIHGFYAKLITPKSPVNMLNKKRTVKKVKES